MAVMLTDRAISPQRCGYRCCDASRLYTKSGKAIAVRRTRRREDREWRRELDRSH